MDLARAEELTISLIDWFSLVQLVETLSKVLMVNLNFK